MNTSKKPTRTGAGCLFAFAAPFCLMGLGTAIAAAHGMVAENPDWKQIGFLALFAAVFGGAGCGVMALSIIGHRKLLRCEELKEPELYPDEEPHQPECSRISVQERIDGTTAITCPACRNPSAAFTATAFLVTLIGATALQVHLGAPLLFPILTSVITSFLALIVVELWLGTTRVTFDTSSIQVTSGILGRGKTRTFRAENISEIKVRTGMRSGRNVYYDIEIVRRSGHRTAAGRHVRSKREAEWLADRMREVVMPEKVASD